MMRKEVGIIDVGTNSIHLLIGRFDARGMFRVRMRQRVLVRLGEGGLVRDVLTRQSLRRALAVLRRYADILRRCGVDEVEAVATSAVRQARNGRAFVQAVRQLGVPLRMISGTEEARLIYLGVLQTQQLRRPTLVFSLGGGSAQVSCGDGTRLTYRASVPLGAARLTQRFIRHDPPQPKEVQALHAYVRRTWQPVARALRRHRWRQAMGSSAMIGQLLMVDALRHSDAKHSRKAPTLAISRSALQHLVNWLTVSTAAERLRLPGLDPRREDLALATGITVLEWMEACGIVRLRFAEGSLREGLVVDYQLRHVQQQEKRS